MKIKKYIKNNRNHLLFALFLISFCLFLGILSFSEYDYFWHIKAGEYMVNNKLILVKDIFSWSLEGHRWFSHEWLFEIILYKLKGIFPNSHIFVYTFVCSLILYSVLFLTNKKKVQNNLVFTVFWIVSSLLFCGLLSARPHMLSNILLAISLVFYKDLFYKEDSKLIYFLPLVSLLWVNVHGGSSSLLYIMGFVFIVCGLFKFKFSKIETEEKRLTKKQILKYLGCIGLSILVLFVNPAGAKMLIYPYTNMGDTFMINFIAEWHPTNFNDTFHLFYILFLVIILLIFVFSKKKIKLLDFVLYGIGVFLGLKSIRFWMYVYIFSSLFIFDYVGEIKNMKKNNAIILISISIMFLFMFVTNTKMIIKEKEIISDEILEKVKEEKPARLYNYYDYGGYLIYNDIKVFVDGRADLYSEGTLVDYDSICRLSKDYENLIERYNFDYYLVPESANIASYLKYSDKYELLIEDDNVLFYKTK